MLTGTRTAIATVAVTSLALTAASPASAIYRDHEMAGEAPTTDRVLDQPRRYEVLHHRDHGGRRKEDDPQLPARLEDEAERQGNTNARTGSWEGTAPMDSGHLLATTSSRPTRPGRTGTDRSSRWSCRRS